MQHELTGVRSRALCKCKACQKPLQEALTSVALRRAEELLAEHRRVRDAAKAKGTYDIRAMEPVDVIGVWVLLPVAR